MSASATSISAIQAELRPGEKLLWSGQPRPGMALRPAPGAEIMVEDDYREGCPDYGDGQRQDGQRSEACHTTPPYKL